jgi:hypothetical protein
VYLVPTFKGKVPWKLFCDFAWRNRLRLGGWDGTVPPPGPGFVTKKAGSLSTRDWELIMRRINWNDNPFFDPTLPQLVIEKWSLGNYISYHLFEIILICLVSR